MEGDPIPLRPSPDPDAWTDDDLEKSIDGVQRELAALGAIGIQIDPIKGPHIDALTDILVEAGLVDPIDLRHRMRIRYLMEMRRGAEELRRRSLLGGHKPGPLLVPRQ